MVGMKWHAKTVMVLPLFEAGMQMYADVSADVYTGALYTMIASSFHGH